MKIEINDLFKKVIADEGKLLTDGDGVFSEIFVPLKMEDAKIETMFSEVDADSFEIKKEIEIPSGVYSKLAIRRTCRELGLESKLNAILEGNEIFKADWMDATEIDLNDPLLVEALKQGSFTEDEIEKIKELAK